MSIETWLLVIAYCSISLFCTTSLFDTTSKYDLLKRLLACIFWLPVLIVYTISKLVKFWVNLPDK
jgi:hypothetical protein